MKRIFALSCTLALAAGCAAPTGTEDTSSQDHAEITATGPWLEPASAAQAGGAHAQDWGPQQGGSGGYYDTSFCPTIVGADGRAGGYLDSFQVLCTNGKNASTDSRWSGAWFGGGGGVGYNATCPNGYVATGIQGGAGTYVDRVSFLCRNASNFLYTTYAAGGPGGYSYNWECPSGQKLIGFAVRHGDFIDAIQPYCGAR